MCLKKLFCGYKLGFMKFLTQIVYMTVSYLQVMHAIIVVHSPHLQCHVIRARSQEFSLRIPFDGVYLKNIKTAIVISIRIKINSLLNVIHSAYLVLDVSHSYLICVSLKGFDWLFTSKFANMDAFVGRTGRKRIICLPINI